MTSKDLLALRHNLGMTQNELAFAIGIRRDSYKQFETGKRRITQWLIKRLEQIQCERSLS